MMADNEALVDEVKALCRADKKAKVEWCAWCDLHVNGTKDPSRLTTFNLQTFMDEYNSGITWADAAAHAAVSGAARPTKGNWGDDAVDKGGDPQVRDLAESVKMGQRVSSAWKAAWVHYAATYGRGTMDPSKHTTEFLASFFEFLGQGFCGGGGGGDGGAYSMGCGMQGGMQGPAKRPRTGDLMSLPALMGAGRPSGGINLGAPVQDKIQSIVSGFGKGNTQDPITEVMAERVRAMQKVDPTKKQLWADFCDQQGGTTKDPRRHSIQALEEFLGLYDN